MKINRNNYELYFIDYLDGNLSDQEIHMLEDFLLLNPDLRSELEGTENIVLSPDNVDFSQKEFLKKPDLSLPVTENNFEDFCIAGAEGDLNEGQLSGLNQYTRVHPESTLDRNLYSMLHLVPDKKTVYPGKERLKKSVFLIKRELVYPVLAVAAAIALMVVVYLKNDEGSNRIQQIASDLPTTSISKPTTVGKIQIAEKPVEKENKHVVEQASFLALSTPKEKKQTIINKAGDTQKKNTENKENKEKDAVPAQRLNPSFQIKLHSLALNQEMVPTIESGKITYTVVNSAEKPEEYLSLSEYTKQQLAKKILGDKEPENIRISAWQVADAGITGINKLTGGDMKIEKKTGIDGNLTAYSFNSRLFSFSRTTTR